MRGNGGGSVREALDTVTTDSRVCPALHLPGVTLRALAKGSSMARTPPTALNNYWCLPASVLNSSALLLGKTRPPHLLVTGGDDTGMSGAVSRQRIKKLRPCFLTA